MDSQPEPIWLSYALVTAIHRELIAMFGGLDGIRDEGLLESALSRPRNTYAYAESTVYCLAAAYANGIARNYPFVDGNKRAALMCIRAFMFQNGYAFEPNEREEVATMVAIAAGKVDEDALVQWISDWTIRRD